MQGWGLAFEGEAFQTGGRTSSEQFRRDPASMRLQTQPIIDKGANRGLVITIQVSWGCGSPAGMGWVEGQHAGCIACLVPLSVATGRIGLCTVMPVVHVPFAACFPTSLLPCALKDMPGWGDEINLVSSLKAVVSFLLEQRKKDLLDNKAGVTGEGGAIADNVLCGFVSCWL